jgi:transposase
MALRRDASKQRCWLILMRRWQRSQLTVREFCQLHQLSEANFYAWRRVLKERGLMQDAPSPHQPPAAFVKLNVETPAEPEPAAPEPAAASTVELVLSERRLLRVRPGFDPATLLALVRLLEEPAC